MLLDEVFLDKSLKPKAKVKKIVAWVLDDELSFDDLVDWATKASDAEKASCLEALELITKTNPGRATENCFRFATRSLNEKAPRIKWESARLIGNIARAFPGKLQIPVRELLANSEHQGTVVRWATAYALGEIIKLGTSLNRELLPAIEAICTKEEDQGVKKKYQDALKKVRK